MDFPHSLYRKMSIRRIVAMALAIGLHLGLLVVMLRPSIYRSDIISVTRDDEAVLEMRFTLPPRAVPKAPVSTATREFAASPKKQAKPRPVFPTARAFASSSPNPVSASVTEPPAIPTRPAAVAATPSATAQTTATDTNNQTSAGDGGFRDRLLNAQHAGDIHGIPGSDRRIVSGIELANPLNQGVGSVMRNTQRLFGITNRHCIDVEVSEHLTPDELIARHLTLDDVKKEEDKYNCNRPLGLSF
jgi:hypothetical protein